MPDANQSIVQAYVRCDSLPSRRERHLSKLFTRYFGGDMSSLLFQELREFRSYAYGVSTSFHLPSSLLPDKHTHLTATLSTQSDKTLDAMTVLNRLLQQMPERTESMLDSVKQSILNDVNNGYPSFRQVSPRIFLLRREGHTADPNREMLTNIATMTMDTLTQFHREQIAGRPVVYTLVGNSKYINLKELAARFGTVIKVNLKELYI